MARTNTPNARSRTAANKTVRTHEGAPAVKLVPFDELRRSVFACMLWENTFYEQGTDIADRIQSLVPKVEPEQVADLAVTARNSMKLRHAPLLLTAALAKHLRGDERVRQLVPRVVRRADELTELPAILARINAVGPDDLKSVFDDALKRGLADTFTKFDGYQLAKYNRDGPIKLRDILFLTHAKPTSAAQATVWSQLVDGTLAPPDTWEVALSTGGDPKAQFERLLREDKLGYMALLRNLRNMAQAGVDDALVRESILKTERATRVLPFRFVAAARHMPMFEKELDKALQAQIASQETIPGKTIVLVDVSASMSWGRISRRSDMHAMDAAATLASVIPAEELRVFTFSLDVKEVPPRSGMAGVDAVINSQPHSGTYLGEAVSHMNRLDYDRLIVITDEQSHDRVPGPKRRGYMINVAAYQNGVGYGPWVHIDGFSEAVINYIREVETAGLV